MNEESKMRERKLIESEDRMEMYFQKAVMKERSKVEKNRKFKENL